MAFNGSVTKGPVYKEKLGKLEIAELMENIAQLTLRQKSLEMSANCGKYLYTSLARIIRHMEKSTPETHKTILQTLIKGMIFRDDRLDVKAGCLA